MANALYTKFKRGLMSKSDAGLGSAIDMASDTIKASLIRGYTPDISTHQFLSDVTGNGGTIVSTVTLGSKTTTGAVFDAADATFTAVSPGSACDMVVIYKDTGTASTSPLVCLIDTATNLPVTPNGGDINISWDNGSNKIFAL
jgi:hypothetical protein